MSAALQAPDARLIPLALIDEGERLRQLNQHTVKALATSIGEGRLNDPIMLRPVGERFKLVAGLHRLGAHVLLGRTEIPAIVREMTELEARLVEIDENLIRAELTPLERISFVAARMQVWAERNPDQVVQDESLPKKQRGRPPKFMANLAENGGYVPTRQGFDQETAEAIGLSERSVRRIVATMTGLGGQLIFQLSAAPKIAENDSMLQALSKISDKAEQDATVKALMEGRAKSVPEARAIATGKPISKPKPDIAKQAEKLWRSMSASEKAQHYAFLSGQRPPKGWAAPARLEAADGEE